MSQGHPAIDVFLRSSQPGLRVWCIRTPFVATQVQRTLNGSCVSLRSVEFN